MIEVTPLQFLTTIFFDVPQDESVLVARPIHNGEYAGRFKQLRPSHKTFQQFSDGEKKPQDWYFGISTVKNTAGNTLKRRKQDMCAVYCVVLDDIGTKCEVPPVQPSWILETSEGNFQYGYMLTVPVENMQWFELFMSEVGKKGFADVGTLDSTRIMRVPLSKNIKEGRDGWLSTVRAWNPDLTYMLTDLAEGFGIKLPEESKVPRVNYITSAYNDIELPDIEDPVFEWLKESGYVRGKQGNGYYEIQCPWHKDHSDGRDEAGYKPLGLGEDPEFRLFKCHHSHQNSTDEFLMWVHDQSGLEVGSCDRVSVEVALTQMANSLGIDASLAEVEDEETDDTFTYNFGEALPNDLFAHRILVGSGKNSKVCPSITVDNLVTVMECHNIKRVTDVISRKVGIYIGDEKASAEYVYGQVRSQCTISDFSGFAGFRDVYESALTVRTQVLNPIKDYLQSLNWDGKSRLKDFEKLFTTDNAAVRDIVIPAWLAQCVAFALGENSGGGSVLVLAGRGGIGKTAILQSLVPEHLRDYLKTGLIMSPGNKDDVAKACSAWISELGELDGTFRRSDMAALKAFLTDEYDSYRPPYGREVLDFKRMTSFSATVNDSLFLADLTGGGYRRFWVLECDEIEWAHDVDVAQLWAEVYHKYMAGTLSRRLTTDQALIVEQAACDAAIYNDDLVIHDFKRLWPSLSRESYIDNGTMDARITERDILSMLPNAELSAASEAETRKFITRLRAYLKDNTPRGEFVRFRGRQSRALSAQGGRHLWLLPKPVAQGVGHGSKTS